MLGKTVVLQTGDAQLYNRAVSALKKTDISFSVSSSDIHGTGGLDSASRFTTPGSVKMIYRISVKSKDVEKAKGVIAGCRNEEDEETY